MYCFVNQPINVRGEKTSEAMQDSYDKIQVYQNNSFCSFKNYSS